MVTSKLLQHTLSIECRIHFSKITVRMNRGYLLNFALGRILFHRVIQEINTLTGGIAASENDQFCNYKVQLNAILR